MLIIWSLIFLISLILLIKGCDWLIESAEKIGLALKTSPFIIGVTIIAFGTSLPELASSLAAAFKNTTEIVAANVIGSNIANILLIIGLSALATKSFLVVTRSLIDVDLPLLASVTVLFGFILWDGKITQPEGILLLLVFMVYLHYTFSERGVAGQNFPASQQGTRLTKPLPEESAEEISEVLSSRIERRRKEAGLKVGKPVERLDFKVFFFLILGVIFLTVGANYLIDSVLRLSEILEVGVSIITIVAVAVGTSLPELVVSVKAAAQKKYEIALGNILGSNIFNALVVIGVPAMVRPLLVDSITLQIGFPFMVIATILMVISGISRRISIWEGSMFLVIYLLFLAKLFGWF